MKKDHQNIPPELLTFARQLRVSMTDAEQLIWKLIRNRTLGGFKFRRQHPVQSFILDFYCHEAKLAIELDGGHHAEQKEKDANRDSTLLQLGIKTLRYWNHHVLQETESVLQDVWNELQMRGSPSPGLRPPSPRGRGLKVAPLALGERGRG
jgi:very-short-patch-repair endonuclease